MDKPDAQISFWLNGTQRSSSTPLSLLQLCSEIGVGPGGYAIEVNGEIVPKSQHESTMVASGDKVEIVHMVGGG